MSRFSNYQNFNFYNSFLFYYKFLKYRIFLLVILSFIVGVLDSISIAIFLPILENHNKVVIENSSNDNNVFIQLITSIFNVLNMDVTFINIILIMFFIICIKGLVIYINSLINIYSIQSFIRRLRFQTIDTMSAISYLEFTKKDAGVIQNMFTTEVNRVVSSYNEFNKVIQNSILVFTYIGTAYFLNSVFAILLIIFLIFLNLSFKYTFKSTKKHSKDLLKSNNQYQKLLIQKIHYFKYLKSTSQINRYADYIKQVVTSIEKSNSKIGKDDVKLQAIKEPLLVGIIAIVVYIQSQYYKIQFSSIVVSLYLFYRGLNLVFNTQQNYNNYLSFSSSLFNLKDFLGKFKRDLEKNIHSNKINFRGIIRLQNISFYYEDRLPILKDVSIVIPKNKILAIVGASGSGKSTLLNNIIGLVSPNGGSIYVDDICFSKIDMNLWQSRIGYITQEPVIFDDTLFNNVTMWSEMTEENLKKFKSVLHKVAIFDYFDNLIDKFQTRLGNKGIRLSGGQIQKICIARELYREIEILIMDEATSALDSRSENVIRESIDALRGEITIIIVAHRLSTVKKADQIVVLDAGEVNDIGTFEELMKNSKLFCSMVQMQNIN